MVPSSSVQEGGLHLRRIIDARRHAVRDQIDQESFFARWRILQQIGELTGLFRIERQWRNTQRGALGNVLAIGFKHGHILSAVFRFARGQIRCSELNEFN
jgi:hypothetical protein